MTIPINTEDLLKQRIVEGERIEYKKSWDKLDVMHAICAFANDINNWNGGYVIIGVEEQDGRPVLPVHGVPKDSVDKIKKELLNVCNLIEPRYIPVSETVLYDDKELILLWVPGGAARPYKCPVSLDEKKLAKAYYIRKLSSTIKANQKEEKELFLISSTIPFDDRLNYNVNLEELRPALISNFLYRVGSDLYEQSKTMLLRDLALNLRIAGGAEELLKPINVGIMFFNERPDNFFRYIRIEVVDKPDPTGIGMVEKYFYGPLDVQLSDALNYIKNYIVKEKTFKYKGIPESQRFENFPYNAIEEALTNAVHHRGYDIPEPITVTVTPEYLEILSLPGPDKSISDKSLSEFRLISRTYRNRRIGEFLKELDMVEARNTGIPRILHALENNGSSMPVLETDEDRTYFSILFNVHASFLTSSAASSDGVDGDVGDNIDKKIIQLMDSNPRISIAEITTAVSMSRKTVDRAIRKLKESGQIKRVGNTKSGHWETLG